MGAGGVVVVGVMSVGAMEDRTAKMPRAWNLTSPEKHLHFGVSVCVCRPLHECVCWCGHAHIHPVDEVVVTDHEKQLT